VDRIVLSHMHFDHTGGFFMLIQGFWLEGRKRDLHVHLPEHGIEPVRALLQSACLFPELLPFGLHFHALRHEECITQGEVRITPVATTHLDGFRRRFAASYPDCYDAFAFVMENERCRVGHSADIGSVADLEPLLTKPLALLVVEASHLRPQDLFARLAVADVNEIVFTHLARPYWEDLQGTKDLAAQALGGRSYRFARDEETLKI
jgi:ribonuclease BN (tRNA processing enzyme)